MEIVKRHKDSNNRVIGYTVRDNNIEKYLNANVVQALFGQITNATILPNGEYRANKGCSIETVIDTKNLLSIQNPATLATVHDTTMDNIEYYGKDFINACKRIRKYAFEGKLSISKDTHEANNGANVHLFKLIEACGIGLEDFIKGYLSVIQPYSLSKFQGSKKLESGNTWLADIGYKIIMVIKIRETNKEKPMVVSFHESNIHGNFTSGQKIFSDKPCAVLVDKVTQLINGYSVDYTVQRGFIRYNINSATALYNNGVALVKFHDIKEVFDNTMQLMFEQLQQNYIDAENSEAPVVIKRTDTGKLSFMSIGFATVNNVYLLLDLFAQYTDFKSRSILVEMTNNLIEEMPLNKKEELKIALEHKFGSNYNNKLYGVIQTLI